jgi:hypothetical protein
MRGIIGTAAASLGNPKMKQLNSTLGSRYYR